MQMTRPEVMHGSFVFTLCYAQEYVGDAVNNCKLQSLGPRIFLGFFLHSRFELDVRKLDLPPDLSWQSGNGLFMQDYSFFIIGLASFLFCLLIALVEVF